MLGHLMHVAAWSCCVHHTHPLMLSLPLVAGFPVLGGVFLHDLRVLMHSAFGMSNHPYIIAQV